MFKPISQMTLSELKAVEWDEELHPRQFNGRFVSKVLSGNPSDSFETHTVRSRRIAEDHERCFNQIERTIENYDDHAYENFMQALMSEGFEIKVALLSDKDQLTDVTVDNIPPWKEVFEEKPVDSDNGYVGKGHLFVKRDGIMHECILECIRKSDGEPYALTLVTENYYDIHQSDKDIVRG